MQTLLLDRTTWDLVLDIQGNLAAASPPYQLAQDASSACRVLKGEVYYDTTQGVPYFPGIIATLPPLSLVKASLQAAALTVPGVVAAQIYISTFTSRALGGQVHVTDANGTTLAAGI